MAIEFLPSVRTDQHNAPVVHSKPAGLQDGDVLWATTEAVGSNALLIPPDGFIIRHEGQFGTNLGGFIVAYKPVLDASAEPSSYTFTPSRGFITCRCYLTPIRGVDLDSMFAVIEDTSSLSPSKPATVSGVTTTVNGAMLLLSSSTTGSGNELTGMTNVGSGTWGNLYAMEVPTAGPTPDRSTTTPHSLTHFALHLTALRPAGGGPPPPTAKPWTRAFVVE